MFRFLKSILVPTGKSWWGENKEESDHIPYSGKNVNEIQTEWWNPVPIVGMKLWVKESSASLNKRQLFPTAGVFCHAAAFLKEKRQAYLFRQSTVIYTAGVYDRCPTFCPFFYFPFCFASDLAVKEPLFKYISRLLSVTQASHSPLERISSTWEFFRAASFSGPNSVAHQMNSKNYVSQADATPLGSSLYLY